METGPRTITHMLVSENTRGKRLFRNDTSLLRYAGGSYRDARVVYASGGAAGRGARTTGRERRDPG